MNPTNQTLGVQTGLAPEIDSFYRLIKEKNVKKLLQNHEAHSLHM